MKFREWAIECQDFKFGKLLMGVRMIVQISNSKGVEFRFGRFQDASKFGLGSGFSMSGLAWAIRARMRPDFCLQ